MYVNQASTFNSTNPSIIPAALQQMGQTSSIITDLTNLVLAINGNITFQDNMAGVFITFTTTTANVGNVINHTLGSIPIGWIVTKINVGGVIYLTGTGPTSTTITLSCSASNATATVFLIPGG